MSSPNVIAPPPVLYLVILGGGFVLQLALPIQLFATPYLHVVLGGSLLVGSAALARWSFVTMQESGTSASPKESSSALVIAGPFRFSRNPIYVAMTGLYLGTDFLANSTWPLALLPVLLALMHWGVIRREERYLAERFGEAYHAYTAKVRRWL